MERNRNIDVVRGIAACLMVLGHCIQYGNGRAFSQPDHFFYNKAFEIIYSFHMPLFMLLSGYLFAFRVRKQQNILAFLKNRFVKILMPIISWEALSETILKLKYREFGGVLL